MSIETGTISHDPCTPAHLFIIPYTFVPLAVVFARYHSILNDSSDRARLSDAHEKPSSRYARDTGHIGVEYRELIICMRVCVRQNTARFRAGTHVTREMYLHGNRLQPFMLRTRRRVGFAQQRQRRRQRDDSGQVSMSLRLFLLSIPEFGLLAFFAFNVSLLAFLSRSQMCLAEEGANDGNARCIAPSPRAKHALTH